MSAGNHAGTGKRFLIFLQVALVVIFAAVATGLITWLSGRPGLWRRWDYTEASLNTLDPVLEGLIDSLPERVTVELFFQPLEEPLTQVGYEAQQRMRELLTVARNAKPEQLKLVEHDPRDLAKSTAAMQELGLREVNVVVVHAGERRAVLRLFRDIAQLSAGNLKLRIPPSLETFRGDQAFGQALLTISRRGAPRVLFTVGHGERELYGTEQRQLGGLQLDLVADGFDVGEWDAREQTEVPADCDVLAVIDPEQAFEPAELEALRRFAARGGRLLVAPSLDKQVFDGPRGMREFLSGYGIDAQAGFIAAPIRNSYGQLVDGSLECAILHIGPESMGSRHPVTDSLRRAGRRLMLPQTRCFSRGEPPQNGVLLDLLRSPATAWRDLPDGQGLQDWSWNKRLEEQGVFVLAMSVAFPAPNPPPVVDAPLIPEPALSPLPNGGAAATKIIAFGCPDAMGNGQIDSNRDFVLNAFNWLASRDERLVIRPRAHIRRRVDVNNTNALEVAYNIAGLGLPGLFALLGLLVWWKRRK